MATERNAQVEWTGSLMEGAGTIDSVEDRRASELDVSWAARREPTAELTSPEELLAAAHAACFSMALSHALVGAGSHAGAARDDRDGHVRPGHRDHADRPDVRGHRAGDRRRPRSSRPPREPRRAARSRRRSPRSRDHARRRAGLTLDRSRRDAPHLHSHMATFDDLVEELDRSYTEAQERLSRPRRLQRPPRGGGRGATAEGARGPLEAGAGVAAGQRRPRRRAR